MFNPRLESLRGIAALMVAVGHSFIVVNMANMAGPYAVHYSDLHTMEEMYTRALFVVFNGGAAVSVFFVLSGYVLGLSLNRKAGTPEGQGVAGALGFIIKRLFRLFPAHIASLSLIVLSLYLFHEHFVFPNASSWFTGFYRTSLSLDNIVDNLLLLATNLNPVTWTLQVELLMSLLFPLAFVLCRSLRLPGNLLALAVIYYFCQELKNFYLLYSFMFYSGLIISQLDSKAFSSLPAWASSLLFALGLTVLLSARLVVGNVTMDIATMECIGAVLIIFVLAHRLEGRFSGGLLDRPWAQLLGRVSYSFYVLHFIVLYWLAYLALFHIAPGWINANRFLFGLALAAVSIPLAVGMAYFSFVWVEKPFIRWGSDLHRKVVSKFSGRANQPSAFSFRVLLQHYPGLVTLLAIIPLLYLAQSTQIFGRSGMYLPLDLASHAFAFSDFLNFHVLALAYPLSVALACLHYRLQPASIARFAAIIVGLVVLGVVMVGGHFLVTLGSKGWQIFDFRQSGNFALAWLSAYGTLFYVVWSLMAGVIVTELLRRAPAWLCLCAALLGAGLFVWGPQASVGSDWPYLFAPWSPLNALPVACMVACIYQFRHGMKDHAVPAVSALLLLSIAAAFYEWNSLVSEVHVQAQLAALPIHSRLSLLAMSGALLLLAMFHRLPSGAFIGMLARYAGIVCLIYPLVGPLAIKAAGALAVDKTSFQHWTLALSFVALYTLGFLLCRLWNRLSSRPETTNMSVPNTASETSTGL